MEIKLTLEQIAYLKSLDSKKKKRKFLLNCFVESIEVEENPIKLEDFLKNKVFKKWEYLEEKPLGKEIEIDTDLKNESESEKTKNIHEHFDHLLQIIKTAEIAEILKTICVKQQDYQYAAKFRELEKKFREKEELIAKSNEVAKLPADFCIKITNENREILQKIWSDLNKNEVIIENSAIGRYLHTNSLFTYLDLKNRAYLPIVTTDEFLKYIGREDLIEKESVEIRVKYIDESNRKTNYNTEEIELVKHNIEQRKLSEQGSELLKFDILEIIQVKDSKNFSITLVRNVILLL